ncbi:hypothetical protein E2C01_099766 [Portunus trituberculatus]|uniref:Uncharacterized protein n=1 Tax=Portunus trituberculatus TaxID=210409 RepID=A0A5B7KB99_PORTR|nr:hypothetical protein [Portunus trituberculatus]
MVMGRGLAKKRHVHQNQGGNGRWRVGDSFIYGSCIGSLILQGGVLVVVKGDEDVEYPTSATS